MHIQSRSPFVVLLGRQCTQLEKEHHGAFTHAHGRCEIPTAERQTPPRPPTVPGRPVRRHQREPPPQGQITALLPMFAPLGLELGKKWNCTKVHPVFLAATKEAVESVSTKPLVDIPPGHHKPHEASSRLGAR
jgi:hypothetical protein